MTPSVSVQATTQRAIRIGVLGGGVGGLTAIPDPSGAPYPALAQHALREARTVARNIHAVTTGRRPAPFVVRSLGTLAAFGHRQAAADIRGLRLAGFLAWWLRRTSERRGTAPALPASEPAGARPPGPGLTPAPGHP